MALLKIAGRWKSKNGKAISGAVEHSKYTRDGMGLLNGQTEARFVVLPNNRKEPGSNQPDYNLFVATDDEQGGSQLPSSLSPGDDNDIPF